MQVLIRIISRLDELDEGETRLIGALQRLGADRCDQCGDWDTDTWHHGDRCRCKRCLEGNPEGVFDESDDEEMTHEIALSVQRYLTGHGLKCRSNLPELKAAYAAITR